MGGGAGGWRENVWEGVVGGGTKWEGDGGGERWWGDLFIFKLVLHDILT